MINPEGANVIYDTSSFSVNHQQLEQFFEKVKNRLPKLGKPIYAGGYQSFFDVTPDLKLILGKDNKVLNLFHCLGAGQALKYAPVIGEIIADLVVSGQVNDPKIDIKEFSIQRFEGKSIHSFWNTKTLEVSAL